MVSGDGNTETVQCANSLEELRPEPTAQSNNNKVTQLRGQAADTASRVAEMTVRAVDAVEEQGFNMKAELRWRRAEDTWR